MKTVRNRKMDRKWAKIIAWVLIAAMVVTSAGFMVFM